MGPLISWDIAAEGLNRRIELREDLKILEEISLTNRWHFNEASIRNSLVWGNKVILLTDTFLNIIYASGNIFEMNGYTPNEVVGNKPKMFQGEKTEIIELRKIKEAIVAKRPFEGIITNYKKNGNTYKCQIEEYPVFNKQRQLVNFLALEAIA